MAFFAGLGRLEPSLLTLAAVNVGLATLLWWSLALGWWLPWFRRVPHILTAVLAVTLTAALRHSLSPVPAGRARLGGSGPGEPLFGAGLDGPLYWALVALAATYGFCALVLLLTAFWRPFVRPVPASRWPRRKLGIALLVAVLMQMATLWGLDEAARRQVSEIVAEARSLSLAAAPQRVAESDNAAVLYRQASEAIRPWPMPTAPTVPGGGMPGAMPPPIPPGMPGGMPGMPGMGPGMPGMAPPPPPPLTCAEQWTGWKAAGDLGFDPTDAELRTFVKQQGPAIALLRKAAARPAYVRDRSYARPSFERSSPERRPFYEGADILALDAICSLVQNPWGE